MEGNPIVQLRSGSAGESTSMIVKWRGSVHLDETQPTLVKESSKPTQVRNAKEADVQVAKGKWNPPDESYWAAATLLPVEQWEGQRLVLT